VRCFSASVGDVTVIVSSVMGKGPEIDEPAKAVEALPAAVLASPSPRLTTPADSMGTARIPSVACPDAVIPRATAWLACVLAALIFCALSAAFVIVTLVKLVNNIKNLVHRCDVIRISLLKKSRLRCLTGCRSH
jgi:hypothetical protein